MIDLCIKKIKPKKSKVFETYWQFAHKRQLVFFNKVQGKPYPWTNDEIITKYKFTNTYRASDKVSQFLIKDVIYSGNYSFSDTFFRILLFKVFNKIETWELLKERFGDITLRNFSVKAYEEVLESELQNRNTIYNSAYIIPSGAGKKYKGVRKHSFHIGLLEKLFSNGLAEKIMDAKSLKDVFNTLKAIESFGDFLAFQFTIDLNYSNHLEFSEMDFVIAGPGALDGIRKCFNSLGDYTAEDIIHMMSNEQESYFDMLGLDFNDLWGRPLQLIDCQNIFCETDKYSRVAHPEVSGLSNRKRIKQTYQLHSHSSKSHDLFYPPKWGINKYINSKLC